MLVVLGFNATLTAKVISWRSVTHYVFPGFLTPVLTQLFFPEPATTCTFLTCFCRGERRKYARKKSCLNRGSNSKPPGHESHTLTTEPCGRGRYRDFLSFPCISQLKTCEPGSKISNSFLFCCHGNQSFLRDQILSRNSEILKFYEILKFHEILKRTSGAKNYRVYPGATCQSHMTLNFDLSYTNLF